MLYFVGLGLHGCEDLTLKAVRVLRKCCEIYIDVYTSIVPEFSKDILLKIIGSETKIICVHRRELEDDTFVSRIIEKSRKMDIAILVPGDPFIATTHLWIRIEAERSGVKTRVIHSSSILTAAISETGLHVYKFGRSTTVVYPEDGYIPYSVYETIFENLSRGLHTFLFLDLKIDQGKVMSISEAINVLELLEKHLSKKIIGPYTLGIALARLGSPDSFIIADTFSSLKEKDIGPPPYSLIIPGDLHFTEEEALVVLAKAPQEAVKKWKKIVRDLKNTLSR
ncbi:MAG: diphthine synthase [Thermoprotei archaeon]|nr:MAG: diphthine synthase [Thermoprotei archaeon]RLF00569.1 MAG: diphthine synthase [Thermoprotei archaeon]HDI74683.1 diphthine synthase [Thermoprotei archaeon]